MQQKDKTNEMKKTNEMGEDMVTDFGEQKGELVSEGLLDDEDMKVFRRRAQ